MSTAIKHPWLLFLGIAVGSLMSGIDFLAISIAIDPMSKSLGIDIATLQWFLTAFAIGNASFLVASGRLCDLYGRKTIFVISSLVFILSSMLIAVMNSPLLIILARLAQGASSGATTSSAIAILANLYAPAARTRWIAGLVGTTGLGMALGPMLGGVLIHYFSWRMIFLINLPLGLVGLAFTFLYMPKQVAQGNGQK
ncbi:MAG TPA: MFS transporter, partial [Chlamydiales bacterium]